MKGEKITKVFMVRNRPIGFQEGRWGGALVAVERGDFPISPTGYRSVAGAPAESITPEFLEDLARAHERERQDILHRLREGHQPVGPPISSYIHASSAYEQAVQHGFFATERDRADLWSGAHQLLCRVDHDARFQPAPDRTFVAWTAKHCAAAMARARDLKALLTRLAAGEFPAALPMRMIGAQGYLNLPPKPGGEPKIDLGGYTAEMALELPTVTTAPRPTRTTARATPVDHSPSGNQMGLFDNPADTANPPRLRIGHF